ncbi:MAG: hypothetical protein B7Z55_15105 [Planctomycetales bacterium 12-60-4]|nr:MAG: hypothetical protein B7Z55_15105 [Planctomycetales bacterium 12-60-4]
MPRIFIDDLDDPHIQCYRELKGRTVQRQGEFFIVEGTKTVSRLLASRYETASVLLTEKREDEWAPQVPEQVPCYILPHELASELVGFNFHVGVVAAGRRQPSPSIDEVLPHDAERLSLVICPKCDNPENLGAIIRIAAGFGVDAILLGKECCDPFSRRVMRVSMGTALRMTLIDCPNLERELRRLRDEWSVELCATILDNAAEPLSSAARSPRFGLLFGNEDTGLEEHWLQLCQRRLTIPMHPGTDSLNVAVAAGIFLHHFTR